MTNFVKKAAALILVVALIFSMAILSRGAQIVSLNDPSVFLKQNTTYTCTLASTLMMFRRGAIINGNANWDSFTEGNYRKSDWWSGGLSWTLRAEGMTAVSHKLSQYGLKNCDTVARRAWFIDALAAHPEGIVIYCQFSSNNAHAVLLTDYDALTDTFYCADPSSAVAGGRIMLGQSELPSHVRRAGYAKGNMTNQDYILSYVNQIWIIESGIDYSNSYDFTEKIETGLSETWVTDTGDSILRVRSGPSTAYTKIGELTSGTTVTVTEKCGGWGHIAYEGIDGWISLEYAEQIITKQAPVLPLDPNTITMTVDSLDAAVFGNRVTASNAPVIVNDRTMLPVRFISEALGATVAWDEVTQTITITSGDTVISMTLGESTAYIGETEVELDSAPFAADGTSYAPVRFIAEALGTTVSWNAETKQITITKSQAQNA